MFGIIYANFFFLFYRNLEDLSTPIYSVNAHKEFINAIDGIGGQNIGCGAPEIVTGSRDGVYSKKVEYISVYVLKTQTQIHILN